MLSQEEIERSMRACVEDARLEPKFFQDLLSARVHAFRPVSDDSPRVRVVMFRQPTDGLHFIPFFTSEAQALEALGPDRKMFCCDGRTLLEATRGATLILNPNHENCTLYPEEVDALLTTGWLPVVSNSLTTEGMQVYAGPPPLGVPKNLVKLLRRLYRSLPYVVSACIVERAPGDNPNERSIIVCLEVKSPHADRAARATANAIQGARVRWPMSIDTLCSNPGEYPELHANGLSIYARKPNLPDTSEIAPGLPAPRLGPIGR